MYVFIRDGMCSTCMQLLNQWLAQCIDTMAPAQDPSAQNFTYIHALST